MPDYTQLPVMTPYTGTDLAQVGNGVVPCLMRYNLTNSEDSIKIRSLKHRGGFPQEGLFRINIIGLYRGFVNEDALVYEVDVVPNTFGNELIKNDAQCPDRDVGFPS
ncbi:uncharacterized protein A4U43_UnF7720 [Asparagus officinalis]|uniref:Uncharacterized protein n=1 Tax=Asparagus officinalis TaxID=4686 RepID=A0A1R3L642_ASPOF|nr:uncharacterized protein A4U43_UnF7720 [Asparagus officinalis]